MEKGLKNRPNKIFAIKTILQTCEKEKDPLRKYSIFLIYTPKKPSLSKSLNDLFHKLKLTQMLSICYVPRYKTLIEIFAQKIYLFLYSASPLRQIQIFSIITQSYNILNITQVLYQILYYDPDNSFTSSAKCIHDMFNDTIKLFNISCVVHTWNIRKFICS